MAHPTTAPVPTTTCRCGCTESAHSPGGEGWRAVTRACYGCRCGNYETPAAHKARLEANVEIDQYC